MSQFEFESCDVVMFPTGAPAARTSTAPACAGASTPVRQCAAAAATSIQLDVVGGQLVGVLERQLTKAGWVQQWYPIGCSKTRELLRRLARSDLSGQG